jgi:hypothetical protein
MADTTSNAESALSLKCEIETDAEYRLGGPITVKGALRNVGTAAIWILDWNTFLDTKRPDCMLVIHNGERLPHTGVVALHKAPDRESFVRIDAGGSVSRKIDISQTYAITEPGEYQLSFYMPTQGAFEEGFQEPPRDESQYKLTLVESKKVQIKLVGEARPRQAARPAVIAPPPRLLGSFPANPKEPTFSGNLSEQEKANFRKAHWAAYHAILAAQESAQRSVDTTLYITWFETLWVWGRKDGWEKRRQTVIDNYGKMADWMATTQLNYVGRPESNCVFDRFAWTYSGRRGSINLCNVAFNDDWIRFSMWASADWGRAFTLIHEISHATCSTTDDQYLWSICEQLASYAPDIAVSNAQNYSLFAMMRAAIPDLPPIGKIFSLRANNCKYLSAKTDGSLVADADNVSDREKFVIFDAKDFHVALKEVNGKRYVTPDASCLLKVSSTELGDAQAFQWSDRGGGTITLKSGANGKIVSFKPNSQKTGFADPPTPYALWDEVDALAIFTVDEVTTSYRRIQIFDMEDKPLGYLDMKDSRFCEAVLQTDATAVHRYRWHKGDAPSMGRLDQSTRPSNRSLTYGSNGNYPCFGLGANWIWLNWDAQNQKLYDFYNADTRTLSYSKDRNLYFGAPGPDNVRLEFDPDDPGSDD